MLLTGLLMIATATAAPEDKNLPGKVAALEKKLQDVDARLQKLESTLAKGGGFTIVTTATCEIKTPANGNFIAVELSEIAARHRVSEDCKAKVSDQTQCQFIKCGK